MRADSANCWIFHSCDTTCNDTTMAALKYFGLNQLHQVRCRHSLITVPAAVHQITYLQVDQSDQSQAFNSCTPWLTGLFLPNTGAVREW